MSRFRSSCPSLFHEAIVVLLVSLLPGRTAAEMRSSPAAANAQLCSLGAQGIGQPGQVICRDAETGAMTQSIAVGPIVLAGGDGAGTLFRRGARALVTNQKQGAVVFSVVDGRLEAPVTLTTQGQDTLSGVLGDRGAYVLTGTQLLFFANGRSEPTSAASLREGDASASQVAVAGNYAYVAERNASLEAFALGSGGTLVAGPMAIAGVPPGAIVGLTGTHDVVLAPIAHLAADANRSVVVVVHGLATVQVVATGQSAASWAASDDGEACVTNEGSMSVSCGHLGGLGLTSYTEEAARISGQAVLDVDMLGDLVATIATVDTAPVLFAFQRPKRNDDFLTALGQFPVGPPVATGVMILPALKQ